MGKLRRGRDRNPPAPRAGRGWGARSRELRGPAARLPRPLPAAGAGHPGTCSPWCTMPRGVRSSDGHWLTPDGRGAASRRGASREGPSREVWVPAPPPAPLVPPGTPGARPRAALAQVRRRAAGWAGRPGGRAVGCGGRGAGGGAGPQPRARASGCPWATGCECSGCRGAGRALSPRPRCPPPPRPPARSQPGGEAGPCALPPPPGPSSVGFTRCFQELGRGLAPRSSRRLRPVPPPGGLQGLPRHPCRCPGTRRRPVWWPLASRGAGRGARLQPSQRPLRLPSRRGGSGPSGTLRTRGASLPPR